MTDEEELAAQFEAQRSYLHAIAYRMLGSHADADDAVQEAWLRGGYIVENWRAHTDAWLRSTTSLGRAFFWCFSSCSSSCGCSFRTRPRANPNR